MLAPSPAINTTVSGHRRNGHANWHTHRDRGWRLRGRGWRLCGRGWRLCGRGWRLCGRGWRLCGRGWRLCVLGSHGVITGCSDKWLVDTAVAASRRRIEASTCCGGLRYALVGRVSDDHWGTKGREARKGWPPRWSRGGSGWGNFGARLPKQSFQNAQGPLALARKDPRSRSTLLPALPGPWMACIGAFVLARPGGARSSHCVPCWLLCTRT